MNHHAVGTRLWTSREGFKASFSRRETPLGGPQFLPQSCIKFISTSVRTARNALRQFEVRFECLKIWARSLKSNSPDVLLESWRICGFATPGVGQMIDRMQRRSGLGLCEICERRPATRKAKFSAQYLQSTSAAVFEEEVLAGVECEKRVCEECLANLQNAKNVTDLTFERL